MPSTLRTLQNRGKKKLNTMYKEKNIAAACSEQLAAIVVIVQCTAQYTSLLHQGFAS